MVSEHASKKRQGLLTSLPGAGLALGIMLGTSFYSLLGFMPKDEFMAYGWRLPFLASVIGIGIGLFIRMRVMESPEYLAVTRTKERPKSPVREVFASHKRNWFVAMFACFAENATTNLVKTFVLAYAATFLHLDKSVGLNGLFVASLVSLFTYPLFGWLGDRLGIGRVYIGSAIAVAAFIIPMFWMINTKSAPVVIIAIVLIYAVAVRGMSATQGAYLANLFPARIRFTGLASSREVGSAISGGIGPVLATLLLAATHSYWPVALYMISQAAITIAAVWIGPSRQRAVGADADAVQEPAAAPSRRPDRPGTDRRPHPAGGSPPDPPAGSALPQYPGRAHDGVAHLREAGRVERPRLPVEPEVLPPGRVELHERAVGVLLVGHHAPAEPGVHGLDVLHGVGDEVLRGRGLRRHPGQERELVAVLAVVLHDGRRPERLRCGSPGEPARGELRRRLRPVYHRPERPHAAALDGPRVRGDRADGVARAEQVRGRVLVVAQELDGDPASQRDLADRGGSHVAIESALATIGTRSSSVPASAEPARPASCVWSERRASSASSASRSSCRAERSSRSPPASARPA
ncbi:MFS transporter [Sinomonas atrocyanea]